MRPGHRGERRKKKIKGTKGEAGKKNVDRKAWIEKACNLPRCKGTSVS